MFDPVAVILLVGIAGLPGAVVGWWRRHRLNGAVVGWVGGVVGAVAMAFLCNRLESVLPHHTQEDVFGQSRVVDVPPEPVWEAIKVACILLGSAALGWLACRDFVGLGGIRCSDAERWTETTRPRGKRWFTE